MKKLIFKIVGISLILVLGLYSCQKEIVNQKTDELISNNDKTNNNPDYEKIGGGSMFVTQWNGVDDCVKPAKDCLPEIVVRPNMLAIIADVDNNQGNYDFDEITNLVQNNLTTFQDIFGDQITDDLINQRCLLNSKITSSKSFLIVSDLRGENTISVRPFVM